MKISKLNKLKQEVEEYLAKEYCCEFKKECKDGVRVRCSEYEAKVYLILRFAVQREYKIGELEQELAVEKDLHQEETNLHLHAEDYIKSLEQQIEKMKRHCNCKHRDSEGYCEVKRTYLMDLSYDGCDKWELED